MLLMAVTGLGQNSYNAYIDTENGTSGNMLTTAMLANSTHTNGIYGTWSITPSPHTRFFLTNVNDSPLRGSLFVGNTYYNGSGDSKTWCVYANGNTTTECQFTLNSAKPTQFAIGWYWRVSPTANLGDFIDTVHVGMVSGDYAVAAFRNDGGSLKAIRIHTNLGNGSVGPDIVVTSNVTYWCTILVDHTVGATGNAKLAVFNASTWRIVGISSLALDIKSTVDYFKFGQCNGHTDNDQTLMWFDDFVIKTGAAAVSEWPLLPVGATVQAATTSRTDFDMAYTNSVARVGTNWDVVLLPTGSSTWPIVNGGYTINKSVVVSGNGTNNTIIEESNVSNVLDQIIFTITGDFVTVSNIWFRGTTPANNGQYYLTVFNTKGNQIRICNNMIGQCMVPIYANFFGCFDNNYVYDFCKLRNIFDHANMARDTIFANYYPPAFDSTNFMFYEDNIWFESSNWKSNSSIGLMTSQNGCAWVFRHNTLILSNSACDFAEPLLDFHGDDISGGLIASMAFQAYTNRWVLLSGQANGKWADIRGTYSQLYSNQFVHASAHPRFTYREERPTAVPNYHVVGSFYFENYYGPTGTENPADFENISPSDIITGVDIIQAKPTTLLSPPYPHLLRRLSAAPPGGGETPPSSLTFGPNVRGMLLRNGRR